MPGDGEDSKENMEKKNWMTAARMGELLGLKKTERYWLIHKGLFETKQIAGRIMVNRSSFEEWYSNQVKYHKVCGAEPGLELRKRSYSARDISILLNIHEQTAYDLIKKEGLKTVLTDGWKRVPKEEFDRWFSSQSRYTMHEFLKPMSTDSSDSGEHTSEENGDLNDGSGNETSPVLKEEKNTASARKSPPGYYSRQEAAMLAGVTELTIINWAGRGHFSQRKAGYRMYIPKEEFRSWMDRRAKGENTDGIDH